MGHADRIFNPSTWDYFAHRGQCMLDAPVNRDETGFISNARLPGRPRGEPVVQSFLLIAIIDFLLKETIHSEYQQPYPGMSRVARNRNRPPNDRGHQLLRRHHARSIHHAQLRRGRAAPPGTFETEIIQVVAQRAAREARWRGSTCAWRA